jgi:acyl-CoA reductase-like NAD-dependent aldehyde dehydrogenase
MAYQSVNPYDGKTLKTFDELTDCKLETALATAATCFETWRRTTFAERVAVVAKASAIMRAHIDEFARPVTLEMGKLIDQARGEVVLSADIIRLPCRKRRALPRTGTPQAEFGRSRGRKQPLRRSLPGPALELSLLSAGALCRAQPDGGKRRYGETRRLRSAVRHRL